MSERQLDYDVRPLFSEVLKDARTIDPDFDAWTERLVMSSPVRPVLPNTMPGADSECYYRTYYEKNPITKTRTNMMVSFVQSQNMGTERKFLYQPKSGLLSRKKPQEEVSSPAIHEWSANIIASDPEIRFREQVVYYDSKGKFVHSNDLRSLQYLGAPDIERIDGNPDNYNDSWGEIVVPERTSMDFQRLENTLKALGLSSLKH